MKCSAFLATSADGYIATLDGGVDWLQQAAAAHPALTSNTDMGFANYLQTVDCIVMGRRTLEAIAKMALTAQQWPYGELPIIVLSRTIAKLPAHLPGNVRIFSGSIAELVRELTAQGLQHAYIDGGQTICSFIQLNLLEAITITQAPVLLGQGISLFGALTTQVQLAQVHVEVFDNNFVQLRYKIRYPQSS